MVRLGLLALLGLASFTAVTIALGPGEQQRHVFVDDSPEVTGSLPIPLPALGFELRPSTAPDEAGAGESLASIRNVTPSTMTAPPPVSGPLMRVGPPVPEPAQGSTETELALFYNPIILAAGTITIDGRDITLAGIEALALDATCGENEGAWPCGRMARTALRRFIRGRAIECEVEPGGELVSPTYCFVAGRDIGAWLVSQGWAKQADALYEDAESAARDGRRGLWSGRRPDLQAEAASG